MKNAIVSISILGANQDNIDHEIDHIKGAHIKWVHFDVMDGCFVKNKSFDKPFLKSVCEKIDVIKDVHIMINDPLIHVSDKVFIFDAPGILEPNYENKNVIAKLALLGSVKQEILPLIALSDYFLEFLQEKYPDNFKERYHISFQETCEDTFLALAKARQFYLNGQEDIQRARITLLKEFRDGTLGRISLDE